MRKWTDQEIEFLKNNFSDKDWDYLMKKLNRTKNSIERKADRLRLKRPDFGNFWDEKDEKQLEELYLNFVSVDSIAKILKRTKNSIRRKITSMTIKRPKKTPKLRIDDINSHIF